jgi:hypothetical protein
LRGITYPQIGGRYIGLLAHPRQYRPELLLIGVGLSVRDASGGGADPQSSLKLLVGEFAPYESGDCFREVLRLLKTLPLD